MNFNQQGQEVRSIMHYGWADPSDNPSLEKLKSFKLCISFSDLISGQYRSNKCQTGASANSYG